MPRHSACADCRGASCLGQSPATYLTKNGVLLGVACARDPARVPRPHGACSPWQERLHRPGAARRGRRVGGAAGTEVGQQGESSGRSLRAITGHARRNCLLQTHQYDSSARLTDARSRRRTDLLCRQLQKARIRQNRDGHCSHKRSTKSMKYLRNRSARHSKYEPSGGLGTLASKGLI